MTANEEPLRLESLLSIAQSTTGENAAQDLLGLCIGKPVCVYFPIPPKHVVAVHECAWVDSRSTQPGARPILAYPGRVVVDHTIKWLALSNVDLKCILDAGVATLACHLNGGLVDWCGSLIFRSFDYCVIRRDSPDLLSSPQDLKPVRLPRDCVFPTEQEIRFKNLFVSRNDGAELRKAIAPQEVPDKWNHKVAAPHVFRMYELAIQPPRENTVAAELIKNDESGVFIKAVANTAASLLNISVGEHAEAGLKIEKISSNEMNKDYSDPYLSKRMSLLLLATDCWINDQPLVEDFNRRMELERNAVDERRKSGLIQAELVGFERQLVELESRELLALRPRLMMPFGIVKYLQELGLRPNQVDHLRRIIEGKKVGGIHVGTIKSAATRARVRGVAP